MASNTNARPCALRPQALSDIPEERFSLADGWSRDEKGDLKSDGEPVQISTLALHIPSPTHDLNVGKHEQVRHELQVGAEVVGHGAKRSLEAIPAIIEYSTSRGRSRLSVREATSAELKTTYSTNGINTCPVSPVHQAASGQSCSATSPFSPSSGGITTLNEPGSIRNLSDRSSTSSGCTDRTSATSIRVSTVSDSDQTLREFPIDLRQDDHKTCQSSQGFQRAVVDARPQATWPSDHDLSTRSLRPECSSPKVTQKPSNPSIRSHSSSSSTALSQPSTLRSNPTSLLPSESRFSWDPTTLQLSKNWFTRWFIEWWALELLSWTFSAICISIVVIVLMHVDGKPPNWDLKVSVNAFISIFSGFAKSALLLPTAEALGQLKWTWFQKERRMGDFEVLDAASRGALGSVMLLGRTKGITLASVGAAIILLSVPLDLFFQQIVSTPVVALIDETGYASLHRSIIYDPSAEEMWDGNVSIIPPDSAMHSQVAPYWLGGGQPWTFDPECSTGNCTFDPFYTLGVDFQCASLPSDMLRYDCLDTSAEWMSTTRYEGPGKNANVSSCGYYLELPDHAPQLMSGYQVINIVGNGSTSTGEMLATRFFPLYDAVSHDEYMNGSIRFGDVKRPIADFILSSTPGGFDGVREQARPVLTECEVHWVVYRMQAEVRSGELIETVLDTLEFEFNDGLDSPWNSSGPAVYRGNYSMILPVPEIHSADGMAEFGLNNVTAFKVWEIWAQIAPSTYTLPAADNAITTDRVLKLSWLLDTPHLVKVYEDALPWDSPANVTVQMSHAVDLMNEVIRCNVNSGSRRHDAVIGTAYKYVTLVKIRWEWISLPVLLLVIALIFLVGTIVRSSRNRDEIGIWKTSALAILFNGPGDDVKDYMGEGSVGLGYTRQKANDMRVKLDGS